MAVWRLPRATKPDLAANQDKPGPVKVRYEGEGRLLE